MKTLTSLFASALIAASLFTSSAFAADGNQITNEQPIAYSSGGGTYHECFLKGNPGCGK